MIIPVYQVDAFTHKLFTGNPAAVMPLDTWLPDEILQKIARENNLSETAFFVPEDTGYRLRWFTPKIEVDLCGHATLAAAYILINKLGEKLDQVDFMTLAGPLSVKRNGEWLVMDFPTRPAINCSPPEDLLHGLGKEPEEVLKSDNYLVVYPSEQEVLSLDPDMGRLKRLGPIGVIATAPGEQVDFVSRFFIPGAGIDEDPVTGSAHCTLTPYWSKRLKKKELLAWQVSARGGVIRCEDKGDRVWISGQCIPVLEGTMSVEENGCIGA